MDKGKTSPRSSTGASGSAATSASVSTQSGQAGGEWSGNTAADAAGTPRVTTGRPAGSGSERSGVVNQVKARASEELSSRKGQATGEIDAMAQAVRDASHRLRDEHHETVATYVEQAAGQLERLSRTIREKDLNELLHDAQRLARRQPAWFIGGSFAIGLLAARFLKSSSAHGDDYARWRDASGGPFTDPEWRQADVPSARYPRGEY